MRDIHDLAAEETEATGNNGIALFQQIAEDGLRAGKAGAGDAQRHLVLCLEDHTQQASRIFEDSEKLRIDMPQLRGCGDAQNTRIDVAWPRAEQQAIRGVQFRNRFLANVYMS